MNLSSRKRPKVSYVTANSKVYIELNGKIPTWQTGFSCIECAKIFVKNHDLSAATENAIKYSQDDFEWIVDTYDFEHDTGNIWVKRNGNTTYILQPDITDIILNVETEDDSDVFVGLDNVIERLDEDFEDIFESVVLRSASERGSVFAASSKEISKNMVRVKSSNIWSYTINIKDIKDKTGDVYVQFKGRNGGPADVYVYYDVPVRVWRNWIVYPSKGAYFWKYIRNNYKYSKLTGNKRGVLPNAVN